MRFCLVVGLLVGLVCVPAWATTVYQQGSAFPVGNVYSSEFDTSGLYGNLFTCWDNFTLAQNTAITGATWQGAYFSAVPGSISQFILSFYGDVGGLPDTTALYSAIITGNASEASVGIDSNLSAVFDYSANFAPFDAAAGTQYWFSVKAYHALFPQWGWKQAAPGAGDGFFSQDSLGVGLPPQRTEGDLTFSLLDDTNGSVVPEPITLVGLGSMLAMGYIANRRRLHARTIG